MSSYDVLITCRRCSKKSQMRDMHYDLNGKDLVCATCAANPAGKQNEAKRETKQTTRETGYVMVTSPPKEETKEETIKQKYYCSSCSYIFLRNQDVTVHVCPYCDKATVKRYTAKSSDDLIKESEYIFD